MFYKSLHRCAVTTTPKVAVCLSKSVSFCPLLLIALIGMAGCAHQETKPNASLEDIQTVVTSRDTALQEDLSVLRDNQTQQTEQLLLLQEKIQSLETVLNKKQTIKSDAIKNSPSVVVTNTSCKHPPHQAPDGRLILGRVEWVLLSEINDMFKARVDTGATTSSVSADNITIFERDGKKWVKFFLTHDGTDNVPMEARLVRYAKIRQASADEMDRRPVVKLNIRIGKATESAEFTLTDRSSMTYPILLGREFLKDVALVDVAKKFLHGRPVAPSSEKRQSNTAESVTQGTTEGKDSEDTESESAE